MGEKLPQKAADEGRTGRKSPFTGRQRHSRPSSQPPSPDRKAFEEFPYVKLQPLHQTPDDDRARL